jgi:hypothetical protein
MPRSRGPNRPEPARESTCSSTCQEAEEALEALGREEEQGRRIRSLPYVTLIMRA